MKAHLLYPSTQANYFRNWTYFPKNPKQFRHYQNFIAYLYDDNTHAYIQLYAGSFAEDFEYLRWNDVIEITRGDNFFCRLTFSLSSRHFGGFEPLSSKMKTFGKSQRTSQAKWQEHPLRSPPTSIHPHKYTHQCSKTNRGSNERIFTRIWVHMVFHLSKRSSNVILKLMFNRGWVAIRLLRTVILNLSKIYLILDSRGIQ